MRMENNYSIFIEKEIKEVGKKTRLVFLMLVARVKGQCFQLIISNQDGICMKRKKKNTSLTFTND